MEGSSREAEASSQEAEARLRLAAANPVAEEGQRGRLLAAMPEAAEAVEPVEGRRGDLVVGRLVEGARALRTFRRTQHLGELTRHSAGI